MNSAYVKLFSSGIEVESDIEHKRLRGSNRNCQARARTVKAGREEFSRAVCLHMKASRSISSTPPRGVRSLIYWEQETVPQSDASEDHALHFIVHPTMNSRSESAKSLLFSSQSNCRERICSVDIHGESEMTVSMSSTGWMIGLCLVARLSLV